MKKLLYLFIVLFGSTYGLYGQDCVKGYCPATIVIHHIQGDLSAETKTITYNVVNITTTSSPTCWITQNLGAPSVPTSWADYGTTTSSGWYFQVNRKQGFVYGSITNFVGGSKSTSTVWPSDQDPCTQMLGSAWRLPTGTEYINAANNIGWPNNNLKLNAAGGMYYNGTSSVAFGATPGSGFRYFTRDSYISSSTTNAAYVMSNSNAVPSLSGFTFNYDQWYPTVAFPVRCLKLVTD